MKMKFTKRIAWILLTVLLYSALIVTPVFAHALLIRSNPAANAVLTQPPVQVELFYSESVDQTLSDIKVYNTSGLEVDVRDVRVDPSDPTRMTVSLHTIPNGIYTVTWKAVSATDGHQTQGTFSFAVGNVNASALPTSQQTTSSSLPISALIAKWFLLASLALLAGQLPFKTFIWNPTLRSDENSLPPEVRTPVMWNQIIRFSFIGSLLAILLGVLSQAGQSTGTELAFPWAKETIQVLFETRLGAIWLLRLALILSILWLVRKPIATWKSIATFIFSLALLCTVSLTSHADAEAHPLIPVLDDWLHLIGMSFWFGGLAYLLTGLRELRKVGDTPRTRLTSLIMTRFSLMALISVGVIGITGLYSATRRVGTISALLTSIYGHALLIKQIFVGALLLLAAINLLIITPRLNRDRERGIGNAMLVNRFGKIVLIETIMAAFLLASVSFLTYLPPARIIPPNTDLTGNKKVDDLNVQLLISPGVVGQNTFTLHLSSNGQPVQSVTEALLRFTPNQGNIPPSDLELIGQGNGVFASKGTSLSLPANWQVQAVVRRENKFDAYANFNFNVRAPGTASESAVLPRVIGSVIILNGLLLGLLAFSSSAKPLFRFGLGGVATLAILGLGVFYLTHPVASVNGQANPIPPNTESVTAGKAIYEVHCVPCHGESGKGDGPLGLTLNPKPADLTLHAIPGVHTDAQLFDWITNGFPGSAMPAWKTKISDTDRWNLVNFIRTLAPKQQ
jgi:copper transport protein